MAKTKHSAALYEVLREGQLKGKRLPAQEADLEPAAAPEETPAPEPKQPPVEEPRPQPQPQQPAMHEPAEPPFSDGVDFAPPMVEVVGGRVQLALTTTGAAIGVFVLGCVLVLAFLAGRTTGERLGREAGYAAGHRSIEAQALDDIREAQAKAPTPGLFKDVGPSPVQTAEPAEEMAQPAAPAEASPWVRGYTYVVVQDFSRGDGAHVQQARQYLADNGIDTVVIPLSGDYEARLITTQGYNLKDKVQKEQAQRFLDGIRELGRQFDKAGGEYALQGYFKTLNADSW